MMKRGKGFLTASAAAALIAVVYTVCTIVFAVEEPLYIFPAPFVSFGKGLRALSLSGSAGNGAAIALYVLFCSIPALVALVAFCRDKKFTASKLLLVLLSAYLFAMIYLLINPNVICFSVELTADMRERFLSVLYVGMAFAFYGLLLLSVCVRLVRKAKREDAAFYRTVRLLCAFTGCVLAFLFFGVELADMIGTLRNGVADAIVGAVTLLLHGALYGLLFAAAFFAYVGVEGLKTSLFAAENAALLRKISRLCLADFLGGIAVCVILNILNLALTPVLCNVRFDFTVSVWVAAVAALCLFACKLLLRAIELYEENRLTI